MGLHLDLFQERERQPQRNRLRRRFYVRQFRLLRLGPVHILCGVMSFPKAAFLGFGFDIEGVVYAFSSWMRLSFWCISWAEIGRIFFPANLKVKVRYDSLPADA